jgi:hypothetical protein
MRSTKSPFDLRPIVAIEPVRLVFLTQRLTIQPRPRALMPI